MWLQNNEPFILDEESSLVGFVYIIINKTKNKYYFGKKNFYSTVTRPPLKGKKRKRKITKQSDWQTYCGSSSQLKDDILQGDEIEKHILMTCTSASSLSYYEFKYQFMFDVMADERSYNGIMNIRLSSVCNNNINNDKHNFATEYATNLLQNILK